jgi:hypothetical protein
MASFEPRILLMSGDLLRPGTGYFVFPDRAVPASGSIRVFYSCPQSGVCDAPIVFAMHGLDRAAAAFRDVLVDQASRNGQIVIVPEFDAQQFPDVFAHNFGGVRRPPPTNTVLPRDQWNFGMIERLFQHVRILLGSNRTTFGLFGNSAGSQYVLRYLALNEAPAVDRAVASNSGVYLLPDLTVDYPRGMGGLDLNESNLRRYLGRRIIILLGDADTDASAPDLPRDDFALAQGPHRLVRGQWHFEHCATLAERLSAPFDWRLQIVHGAGHLSQQVFDRAANILKSPT